MLFSHRNYRRKKQLKTFQKEKLGGAGAIEHEQASHNLFKGKRIVGGGALA